MCCRKYYLYEPKSGEHCVTLIPFFDKVMLSQPRHYPFSLGMCLTDHYAERIVQKLIATDECRQSKPALEPCRPVAYLEIRQGGGQASRRRHHPTRGRPQPLERLNPRTAGGLSHLRTARGRMTAPPPPQRTRKLRKIATSGKRRSIGRGKFYKNA